MSSSDDDNIPGLVNRDPDGSSSDDDSMPALFGRDCSSSSDSSERNDSDSDSDSDGGGINDSSDSSDGMPSLVDRDYSDGENSDSDEDSLHSVKRRSYESSSDSVEMDFRGFRSGFLDRKNMPPDPRTNRNRNRNRKAPQTQDTKIDQVQKRLEKERKERRMEEIRKERERKAEELQKKKIKCSTTIAAAYRGYFARNNFKKASRGFTNLQAITRGFIGRKRNAEETRHIQKYRNEYQRFKKIWGKSMDLVKKVVPDEGDWSTLKDKQAYIRREEFIDGELKEMDKKLTDAMADAMQTDEDEMTNDNKDFEIIPYDGSGRFKGENVSIDNESAPPVLKRIHLSADVVKWLRMGDRKYRDFFIRRMKQLAHLETEERSRILGKRLVGSKHTIYETYLEQKSGFRILWTEKGDYLLVWYVAKHKSVPRLMKLIDESKKRSKRQRMLSVTQFEEMKHLSSKSGNKKEKEVHEIFLDPLGNVPLKVYDIETDDIDEICEENWTPVLHLTDEERDVVDTRGSVLLLGRSGTGKTICICNRMERDRQKFGNMNPEFSQLFVARSDRLCRYVEKNIGLAPGSKFVIFKKLVNQLEALLPQVDGVRSDFSSTISQRMDFPRFREEVYDGTGGVDALIVWTNMRSFLKGSVEALTNSDFFVPEHDYLSFEHFGKKRCRFSVEQRRFIYDIFLKYQEQMKQYGYWDDCDRIISLVRRLCSAKTTDPEIFQGDSWCKWSKIYVDEVQDYTQAECLLFFHLSGAGNLFFAGDPAQNVVRGVEFRFEDIRSVGYYIAGTNRDLIPDKPKIVNINFRSHAGILGCAASILSQMFAHFPDSAKQLGKDDGLFQGPRPGVFHKAKLKTIGDLLAKNLEGTVILTHDEKVDECKESLGDYQLVYGIIAAKGLEFKTVIVLNFFSSLPDRLQKPWRDMLLGRADHKFSLKYPEVESQLKLLYTAVTRCIDRLFFAETISSISGDAFNRWMTTTTLKGPSGSAPGKAIATSNNIEDVENMKMTRDEWLASGISSAEAAEAEEDNEKATKSLLKTAIYQLEQAKHEEFVKKARLQLESFDFRCNVLNNRRTGLFDPQNRMEFEVNGGKIMEKLLKENLLLEARRLGKDLLYITKEIYSSSNFLQHLLVEKISGD